MIYDLTHKTVFDYSQRVSISHHVLHLSPRPHSRQNCVRTSIIVEPAPSIRSESIDFFGNPITYLTIQEPHDRLLVHASSRIDVFKPEKIDLTKSRPWEEVAELIRTTTGTGTLDAYQYAYDSPYVVSENGIFEYAAVSLKRGRPILAAARDLTRRIFKEFEYRGGVTDISTPVDEVLETRRGVCQDFAHLQIACLRSHGLPARYVSGYLMTHPPEGKEKLVGADASHAWVSVWCPDLGWVDFDPTNDMIPSDEHIALSWGRDYGDVSPINGVIIGGGSHTVKVSVDVAPVKATRKRRSAP